MRNWGYRSSLGDQSDMPEDPPSIPIRWRTLRHILDGRSPIDFPRVNVSSEAEAVSFLAAYGFDWQIENHRDEIDSMREQAVTFVENELLDGEQIPEPVRMQTDLRKLLIWASSRDRDDRALWSCALLRVLHALAHSHSFLNDLYGDEVRNQILEAFEPHLHIRRKGLSLGRRPNDISLVDFEVKPAKSKHSVLLKLLHKPESVAASIFDRIGVRFITEERFDVLLVANYLDENNVVSFSNLVPGRTRNTLIDLDWLEDDYRRLQVSNGRVGEETGDLLDILRGAVQVMPYPAARNSLYNPHTSSAYHALQFTCRKLIWVNASQNGNRVRERFFFPFEIQILDEESYRQSRSGFAAYDEYKARQKSAVRKRVFGELFFR
jgi:uncharacterized protein (TIGR04562 family)